jgi:YesN/AraC family two-component response regulator
MTASSTDPQPQPPPRLNALIVDDESPARERLRRLLDEIDEVAVIGEASNGRDALDLCARLDPDVVLLDVRMPAWTVSRRRVT